MEDRWYDDTKTRSTPIGWHPEPTTYGTNHVLKISRFVGVDGTYRFFVSSVENVRYSSYLYSTLLYSPLLCSTLLYSALLYSTLLYSTLFYSTRLDSTLPYSTLDFHLHERHMTHALRISRLPPPRKAQPPWHMTLWSLVVKKTIRNSEFLYETSFDTITLYNNIII